MEPLSATASVISVVGLLSQSCGFVATFFRGISDAPVDIKRHRVVLQGLDTTVRELHTRCRENASTITLSPAFSNLLAECMADFATIETKLRQAEESCGKGYRRRIWGRMKWSLSSEHWLGKFLRRLQQYCAVISLELQLLALHLNLE